VTDGPCTICGAKLTMQGGRRWFSYDDDKFCVGPCLTAHGRWYIIAPRERVLKKVKEALSHETN